MPRPKDEVSDMQWHLLNANYIMLCGALVLGTENQKDLADRALEFYIDSIMTPEERKDFRYDPRGQGEEM